MKTIQSMFSEVPETYERVNHILTFCFDILWRKSAVKIAVKAGGERWLDVCTGTGEMASYLHRLAKNGTGVYAIDFSLPMLRKATKKPEGCGIKFLLSDIKSLPFSDETFDLITISFATRNINLSEDILISTFQEFYRLLRVGGYFVNLETSQPSYYPIRRVFHQFVKLSVTPVGRFISGSKPAYSYLANTITQFYQAEKLKDIMGQAGFKDITIKKLMFGAAAIHRGVKY